MNNRYTSPVHYRTQFEIWGLPLVDVRVGEVVNGRYRRGVAKGWIAIGDVAFGGLSLGALALGGLAIGGCAFGGAAIGVCAIGGAAIALKLALGGLAISGDVALGGVAIAPHANLPGGPGYELPFSLRFSNLLTPARLILFALPLVLFVVLRARAREENASSPRSPHR